MEYTGLTSKEVKRLQESQGPNELNEFGRASAFTILLRQVTGNFVIYLLIFAAGLSFFVEKSIAAYTLLFIIVLVTVLGFVQEYRAETAIAALKRMITPTSLVIREGKEIEIPSRELVFGDIVLLRTGERVPADGVVLHAVELKLNESILTGESSDVGKTVGKEEGDKHTVFMGTYVVSGKAVVRVCAIGMKTRFGSIAGLISGERKELPLQKKINVLARYMVLVGLFFALVTGTLYAVRAESLTGETIADILLVVIALAVASFPEGFPVVLITTLSAGTHRMALQNAIVNRMSVIETLGETTVICSDKTGTLTKGEMTAKYVYSDGVVVDITGTGYTSEGELQYEGTPYNASKDSVLDLLCKSAVACNDATLLSGENGTYTITGTPTEAALLVMAAKAGYDRSSVKAVRRAEIPFTSERKRMSVLASLGKESYVFTKGAPEYVLERCSKIKRKDGIFSLTSVERKRLDETIQSFTTRGYRTIAFAYVSSSAREALDGEKELIFLGFVALEDPPRPEVMASIRDCRNAGIAVKMITGDNKETALSIASQIGLSGPLLTGAHLDGMSDDALASCVRETVIFARVRPEHKIRIVTALKKIGEIVTMTGDGVNDAPALKAAHIGVAMGKSGTDVSRSVADITLKDDNFATIVHAVREGRTIFNNMRKFITYEFSCTYAEIILMFTGVLLGLPIPLVALQILFMNMVTSDFPAITLGLNPSSDDVMLAQPRRKAHLLSKAHIQMLMIVGTCIGLGTLGIYSYVLYGLGDSLEMARTTALVCLIMFEIFGAFNFRSFRKGVFTRSPFSNKYLIYASLVSLVATLCIIYTPLNVFFETTPLDAFHWALALVPCLFMTLLFDILKKVNEQKNFWEDVH